MFVNSKIMTEELEKKVQSAIKLIQSASKIAAKNNCPEIEIAYSGGKDSDVILELTRMAGVPYRAIYKNTTIDPPYTAKHCRDNGVEIRMPKRSFYEMIKAKFWPTRFARFCCSELKEYKISDYVVLGIRSAESSKRKQRYTEPEACRVYRKGEKVRQYFPILNWTNQDIINFANERKIKFHPLYYDENGQFHPERRLGCIACPLASKKKRLAKFKQYPNFVKLYIRGGQFYQNTHPNKNLQISIYEHFVRQVFCDSIDEFEYRFGKNLFGDAIDCKQFLEDYFQIKL